MTEPRYDVIAIGNAIVDVMAPCEDALVERLGMQRGAMVLVDPQRAEKLYAAMPPAREISGGSAANTLAGLAALGARCAFIGQVAQDQLGEVFAHDIRAAGIAFDTPPRAGDPPTGRCLIFVSPDGQRTMNTCLGASQFLPSTALDLRLVADAAILYLEGYLWDPPEPRAAMRQAMEAARAAGRTIAFTLSDAFVIERHGGDFLALIEDGLIDILFANHIELAALTGEADFEAGLAARRRRSHRDRGGNSRRRARRAGRAGGGHDRRGRPVRRRLPVRPCAGRGPADLPCYGRGGGGGDHRALRRAAGGGLAGADGRAVRVAGCP